VLVDGKPQRRDTSNRAANVAKAPIPGNWVITGNTEQIEGTYDEGYGTVEDRIATHKRTVTFSKGKSPSFTVVDTLTPNDDKEHTYQVRWHLLTTAVSTGATTNASFTFDPGRPNLLVLPLGEPGLEVVSASAQTTPELLGWNVRKDMDPQYVPATTVLHTRRGKGVQTFVTQLIPIKPGEQKLVNSVERKPDGIHIHFADGKDDFSIISRGTK
jgi:hypothetical protein